MTGVVVNVAEVVGEEVEKLLYLVAVAVRNAHGDFDCGDR